VSVKKDHVLDYEIRLRIIEAAKRLYLRGLITSLTGNISNRSSDKRRFWITPSGKDKYDLKPYDMSLVDIDSGEKIAGDKPSSEYLMHLYIYRVRDDVESIVHAHSPYTLVLFDLYKRSQLIKIFEKFSEEYYETKTFLRKIDVIERTPPGTVELAEKVSEVFKNDLDVTLLVLKGHGVVSIGNDLTKALNRIEVLEDLSKIYIFKMLLIK
jgi:L-fuculose-phosphate aldolase